LAAYGAGVSILLPNLVLFGLMLVLIAAGVGFVIAHRSPSGRPPAPPPLYPPPPPAPPDNHGMTA
jgi:hypothetical protein